MDAIANNIAGIDIHKSMLAVVVRQQVGDTITYIKRAFGTTKSEIEHLAAWLQHHEVAEAVMESTAQYWRPIWNGLECHFQLHLTHPLKTRAPRGRKRDFRDAQRLADRWHSKDLEESYIPRAEQREWRWLTRSRLQMKRKMTVMRNHVEGLLEQGGIKLTAVVTDIQGVSGWAMLERIANGETDVDALLNEARGRLGKKKPQLREALLGNLAPVYRLILKQTMDQIRLLRNQVEEINAALAEAMKDYVTVLVRLTKIPGIDLYAAQELLAEIGPTASAFPSASHFASWIGVCPGSQESAGVNYSPRSAKGNRYLRRLLCQIAWAAVHAKDTFFNSLFHRLKPKIEGKGAAWAVAHRVAKIVWLVLHNGVDYEEKGPTPTDPRKQAKKFKRLVRTLTSQGFDVRALLDTELAAVDVLGR